jgi:two-component system OmpR family sensor kinase
MSIRLRLTLLYTAILALILIVFGAALYTIQAQFTLNTLKHDLVLSSDGLFRSVLRNYMNPNQPQPGNTPPPPPPLDTLSSDQAFNELREREIVRILKPGGELLASPFGVSEESLPLSSDGLQALNNKQEWWQIGVSDDERLLIYNRPGVVSGDVVFILQVARSLDERDSALAGLSRTLLVAGLLTILAAFGIGWVLAGMALRPIHRITQTARAIGNESDFSRRVDYVGPNDEIGQLATTFNSMLSRLQEAYQLVSRSLKMQRDFVADVSHELRTPLTTVRGNLALLKRVPPPPADEQSDILTDLVDESDRLICLLNDLLVLAKADAGRSLVIKPVAIKPIVEEACRQARQLDAQREVNEIVQEVTALGDRDALKQVLLILLDNAIKHTPGMITVTAAAGEGQVVLKVKDSGPGIPADKLEHVFDRFYRVETDSMVPGFGLGLPIAKALIEEQDGTICIDSDIEMGSIVTIRLPEST